MLKYAKVSICQTAVLMGREKDRGQSRWFIKEKPLDDQVALQECKLLFKVLPANMFVRQSW